MLASVRTRVVSWKLAAEMKLSVESDALVMPSRSGRPVAGRPRREDALLFHVEAEAVDLLLEQEVAVADVVDLDPAEHLTNDRFDVLVGDGDTLEAVDLLDFVDEVALQFLFAEDGEHVVRVEGTVEELVAGAEAFAFLDVDVDGAGYGVLALIAVVCGDVDLALTLDDFAEADDAVDFRDGCGFAGLACLEEFDDARQTAGDVLGAGGLTRDLGEDVAGCDLFPVRDHEVRAGGHEVALLAPSLPLTSSVG